MTTDTALAERIGQLGRDMMEQARLATPDRMEQITALLCAATSLIEMSAGRGGAAIMLSTLLAPTIGGWTDGGLQ